MGIERLNPEGVYLPPRDAYTQVVVAGGVTHQVEVAGMVAWDEDREVVGEGDVRAQTRLIMEHIGTALAAAGCGPEDVVRIMTFTLDIDGFRRDAHREVLEFFGEHRPASTLVEVSRLADPRFLVEIQVTAVRT